MTIQLAEFDTYQDPQEGTTYISPQFKNKYGATEQTVRLVTRGIDQTESYTFTKIKKEIVIRETPGGKNIIRATVFENPRSIEVLNIQEFTPATGSPHKASFSFIGEEIPKLFKFIKDVIAMQFGSQRYQRLSDDDIEYLDITDKQAQQLFSHNQKMLSDIVRNGITNEDVVAVGYRKKQIEVFDKLLNNPSYFEDLKSKKKCGNEKLWQQFFEKNQWVFGYGLGYVFLTGLEDKKLEQVVQGYDISSRGKRVDAMMKTRGYISNICFVEIKTHITKLLEDTAYRPGCFAPSKELSGAITQVQGSVASAVKSLSDKLTITYNSGNPTGEEIYNYNPKSFLVIGSLDEFSTDKGINLEKFRSFELFRKSLIYPEIITFDELYERAKFIINFNDSDSREVKAP